ncbi:MAG TPA: alternative ribosome rescue aminoacyl-tRNA hydrolase ArfB [Gemmatimonadales bacterium]|nr:alternative ribosome rescue aminoacyl-tRNA hydrolase ArfB [Gemmatimonadales bacterium]
MADPGDELVINARVRIPRRELTFQASRSGGPGGQHVNTSSTRVELWWDAAASPSLTPAQRQRVIQRLGSRLDSQGRLRVVASSSRSQTRNRDDATARFVELLAAALVVPKRRRATRPTAASRERRLESKRRRGDLKRGRGKVGPED